MTGGFPAPETPWALVLETVRRRPMYLAREQLVMMDAVTSGITAALGGGALAQSQRDQLVREAFPQADKRPVWLPNPWEEGIPEGAFDA